MIACVLLLLFGSCNATIVYKQLQESLFEPSRDLEACRNSWNAKILDRGLRETINIDTTQHKNSGVVSIVPTSIIQHNKTILFIHVGKTCGESVATQMHNLGINFAAVHLSPADEIMINQFEYVIISLRDPLQRTISAFNHCLAFSRKHTYMVNTTLGRFYECFNHTEEYVHALYKDSTCGANARLGDGFCQITWDTCSYLGGVFDALEKKKDKVFIVRTDSCEEDLKRTFNHIGLDSSRIVTSKSMSVHTQPKPANSTSLSLPAQMKLRGYLETIGEYDMYREMIRTFVKW